MTEGKLSSIIVPFGASHRLLPAALAPALPATYAFIGGLPSAVDRSELADLPLLAPETHLDFS